MVTPPLILLVAVAASSHGLSMTQKAADVCVQTLHPGARSLVRVLPTLPDDVALLADASAVGATALVVLTWNDAALLTTDVRVSITPRPATGKGWIRRTVAFSAGDLPAERARTLGLVTASMLAEAGMSEPVGPQDTSASPATSGEEPASPLAPGEAALAVSAAESSEAPQKWALEADVSTVADDERFDFDTVGAALALRRSVARRWALRAGLGFRFADVDGVGATTRTTSGSLGVAWTSAALAHPHQIGFGARLDLMGVREEIRRDVEGSSSPPGQSYWTVGCDLVGQVGFGLSRATALLLGGGVEEVLTTADLVVADQRVATIPRQRVVFELGLLSRF
jgi:hypothetical protein